MPGAGGLDGCKGWGWMWVLVGVIGVILGGCGGPEQRALKRLGGEVAVKVKEVRVGPISEFVFIHGTVRAVHREYLYFQRPGRVVWMAPGPGGRPLREGDQVYKGQVLARLDEKVANERIRAAQAALAAALTNARLAEEEKRRRARLLKMGAVSQATYEQYKAAADAAWARVEVAKAQLKEAELFKRLGVLVAPVDGVIAYLNCRVGYYFMGPQIQASSESELLNLIPMVLVASQDYEVTASLPYFQARAAQVGQRAFVSVEPLAPPPPDLGKARDRYIELKLFSVSPAVDPGGRLVRIKLRTLEPEPRLMDGMHVSGWLETRRVNRAVLVPLEGIVYRDGISYCWVVKGSQAEFRRVELGIYDDRNAQVLNGLKPGELVATEGRYLLSTGARVKVVGRES